jgi:hypothetical protein
LSEALYSRQLRMRYVCFFMAEKAYQITASATLHSVSRNKAPPISKVRESREIIHGCPLCRCPAHAREPDQAGCARSAARDVRERMAELCGAGALLWSPAAGGATRFGWYRIVNGNPSIRRRCCPHATKPRKGQVRRSHKIVFPRGEFEYTMALCDCASWISIERCRQRGVSEMHRRG